ncbi:hypothetical protein AN958_01310 [Leucoagaricus sp. SymC.cos]|nr:hypothetical protein AN958_01310 [Leucoagaricus sp. SymC.cos]
MILLFPALKLLKSLFSQLKTVRYHQQVHSPFPLPLLSYCEKLERLDLLDIYPHVYNTDPLIGKRLSLAVAEKPTSPFSSLTELIIVGEDLIPKLEPFLALNVQDGLPHLQTLDLSYSDENSSSASKVEACEKLDTRDGNYFDYARKAHARRCPWSVYLGKFLQLIGGTLTHLKFTMWIPYNEPDKDLASTGCLFALVCLTDLEVTFEGSLFESMFDIVKYPQEWIIKFLKALPVKDELTKLCLTYSHDID